MILEKIKTNRFAAALTLRITHPSNGRSGGIPLIGVLGTEPVSRSADPPPELCKVPKENRGKTLRVVGVRSPATAGQGEIGKDRDQLMTMLSKSKKWVIIRSDKLHAKCIDKYSVVS